jgi:hypothetical protein
VWGVELSEGPTGVVVGAALSSTAALHSGDRILAVRTHRLVRSEAEVEDLGLRGPSELDVVDLLAGRGSALGGPAQPVRTLADLRGYGQAWAFADVIVDRDDILEVVRIELGRPLPLPIHPWQPEDTHARGLSLTRLSDWPDAWRPRHAAEGDVLVVHVGHDSLAGVSGLRPLELLRRPLDQLHGHRQLQGQSSHEIESAAWWGLRDAKLVRVQPDGHQIPWTAPAREWPLDAHLLGVFRVFDDGRRSEVELGPWGMLFHRTQQPHYDLHTDTYVWQRWTSLASVVAITSEEGPHELGKHSYRVEPFPSEPPAWR